MRGFTAIFAAIAIACATNFVAASADSSAQGDSALIPCKSSKAGGSSDGNLKYEWKRGDDSGDSLTESAPFKGRVAIALNGDLLINRFTSQDHGKYTCYVQENGSTIDKATVDVDDTYRLPAENCHPSGCIGANKCSSPRNSNSCPDDGEVCCETVREEDKYLCRHFLGECLPRCNAVLLREDATDCEAGTQCCVLV